MIEEPYQRPARDPGASCFGIHADAAHRAQVNHHAPFDSGHTAFAMAAALDGEEQTIIARQIDRSAHIGGASRLHDEGGTSIESARHDATSFLVAVVLWKQQPSMKSVAQFLKGGARYSGASTVSSKNVDCGKLLPCRLRHRIAAQCCSARAQSALQEFTPFHGAVSLRSKPRIRVTP